MIWARMPAYVTGTVDQELLLRNEYLSAEKSLTVAAGRKLHTSQPSLCRQIRDLEEEVGAQLLTRRARGIYP